MLLRELVEFHVFSLDKAVSLQKLVNFLWDGIESGRADTIAIKDFGVGLCYLQIGDAALKTAAAKGTERDDFLSAKIDIFKVMTGGA